MENENKLIAEFMGYKVVDKPKVVNGENFFEYIDENGNYTYCKSSLKYNTHWDWLMPVVESIFERLDSRDNSATEIKKYMLLCCLDETYNAVVEFINQYNKNK